MFSEVILAAPMYMVFKHLGLLDTKLALIIANISVCLPMSLWLLYSYIKDIPKEIEEAAWVDGCSRLQGVWFVLAPLILPGLMAASVMSMIPTLIIFIFIQKFLIKGLISDSLKG